MSDTAKHTPGPWTTKAAPYRAWICRVGNNADDPDVWTECECKPGESYEWGSKIADARLIAAAPELLAALQLIVQGLTSENNKCWPTTQPWTKKERDSAMLQAARAAIAKATGAA